MVLHFQFQFALRNAFEAFPIRCFVEATIPPSVRTVQPRGAASSLPRSPSETFPRNYISISNAFLKLHFHFQCGLASALPRSVCLRFREAFLPGFREAFPRGAGKPLDNDATMWFDGLLIGDTNA